MNNNDFDKISLEFFNRIGLCSNISGHWYNWEIIEQDDDEITVTYTCGIDEEGHSEKWTDSITYEKEVAK